ncbi:MAG: D-TA family PLP-dependent enzyme [Gemmatimonadetes bacterium]|nr:MAG: D-TA family PLP-dependent enzyme [Gemmatimonadota bacterium]
MTLDDLETPAALVDLARCRENARAVTAYLAEHGLTWRPHIKTHKSPRIARIQLEAGARGLTVATPREAEVMSTVCDDLLLAYPVLGERKLRRVAALLEHVRLTVGLDGSEALDGLAAAARAAGGTAGVLVEMDVGMRRVGVGSVDEVVRLAARAAGLEGTEFRGVMFYPGHIRGPASTQDQALAAVAESVARVLEALDREGLVAEIVSGGSTPTLWRSHDVPGMTEVRAGTAIYFDREGVELGVAEPAHVAYSVLATVVSTAVPGQAVVDAGSKALAKEARGGDGGGGFGVLLDRPEVVVAGVSEEHGVLDLARTAWRPRVGERVRIVPNHVCVSVNLQDRVWGLGPDGALEPVELPARGRGPFRAEGAEALV